MKRYHLIAAVLAYVLIWQICANLDREHCEVYGVSYGGTSLGLDGFCEVSGVRVPAEWIGRD
jgi:hypothetical protein